ncbi:hypothetical protein [Enterococcus sp. BWR-S5]|uniref:hypothetical protein n=1 Tax=Enterococcus sp. BWR-S5 TaxID=2787714 RepID=UPI0019230468|nr:hypothetical protein [Enterococcus sp. BWR-S5]MBL1223739.1 hypothetical protein [Enterococcus sp. BWR-S5]
MRLQLAVFNRQDLALKSISECYDWEINIDYLTNEKSSFIPLSKMDFETGDFFMAKEIGSDNQGVIDSSIGEITTITPLFLGVIDSIENDAIKACIIYSLMNFPFAATRATGSATAGVSAESHLTNMFTMRVTLDLSKKTGLPITPKTHTAYSYLPSDPPTVTNLLDYVIGFFKKYNIVLDVDYLSRVAWYNRYNIVLKVERRTKKIRLKNNAYDFVNWSVYEQPAGKQAENMLQIIDKRSTNSIYPIILSTWYIDKYGELTQSLNDNIYTPTRQKIYIYDMEQEDRPTYLEVAQSELAGQTYAHEINFDIKKDNNMIDIDDLEVGLLVDIVYNDTIYSSVLTGYVISSESEFISLRFGHVRSTLQDVLNNL